MLRIPVLISLITALLTSALPANAQPASSTRLSLRQVIDRACEKSPAAQNAKHALLSAQWQYRYYTANYLPSVTLSSTPSLNRQINKITLNDGTSAFIKQNQLNSDLSLTIGQNIALTGGSLFLTSALSRLDEFERHTTSYSSNPITIGYRQSLFGYNDLRWDRRIEPVRYREALKNYNEAMELVAVKYRIFPADLGKETFVTKTLSGPEAFSDDYKEMQRAVSAGNLNYCSIATVTDADGVLVYDSDAFQEGPELPDETTGEILEMLGNIDADIQSIAGADAAYRTDMMLLQEQNAELLQEAVTLQRQNETLQKEMLASNVAAGFVLILTLGYTVAHGFFQRMKVG